MQRSRGAKKPKLSVADNAEQKMRSSFLFPPRKNDYDKPADVKNPKSLSKDRSRFTRNNQIKTDGGTGGNRPGFGPHDKKSSKGSGSKLYYLGPHEPIAYFAYEIMSRLGIRTPKARLVPKTSPKGFPTVATRSIDNYIPMQHVWPNLDIEKQVVIDSKNNEEYKISGNLFAADILAILLEDHDFQPTSFNFGVKRVGNRYYAVAIDKEQVHFKGQDYENLKNLPELEKVTQSELFKSRRLDQELVIINELAKALNYTSDEKQDAKPSDIDKIFFNSRVKATTSSFTEEDLKKDSEEDPKKDPKKLHENFIKSAKSLIRYYKKMHGDDCLEQFVKREELRKEIAHEVINSLDISSEINKTDLEAIIVEDLRGPYYEDYIYNGTNQKLQQTLVENREALKNFLVKDLYKEFGLQKKREEKKEEREGSSSSLTFAPSMSSTRTRISQSQSLTQAQTRSGFWRWHDNLGLWGKILFWGMLTLLFVALGLTVWGLALQLSLAGSVLIYGAIGAGLGAKAGAASIATGAACTLGGSFTAGAVAGAVMKKSSTSQTAKKLGYVPSRSQHDPSDSKHNLSDSEHEKPVEVLDTKNSQGQGMVSSNITNMEVPKKHL